MGGTAEAGKNSADLRGGKEGPPTKPEVGAGPGQLGSPRFNPDALAQPAVAPLSEAPRDNAGTHHGRGPAAPAVARAQDPRAPSNPPPSAPHAAATASSREGFVPMGHVVPAAQTASGAPGDVDAATESKRPPADGVQGKVKQRPAAPNGWPVEEVEEGCAVWQGRLGKAASGGAQVGPFKLLVFAFVLTDLFTFDIQNAKPHGPQKEIVLTSL